MMKLTEQDEQRIATLKDMAKELFESHGNLMMTIFEFRSDSDTAMYIVPLLSDDVAKDNIEALIVKLIDSGAKAIALIMEAWSLEAVGAERAKYNGLANHPDREEAVCITYSCPTAEVFEMAAIMRSRQRPRLANWVRLQAGLEGRFAQFWQKARALHAAEN